MLNQSEESSENRRCFLVIAAALAMVEGIGWVVVLVVAVAAAPSSLATAPRGCPQ